MSAVRSSHIVGYGEDELFLPDEPGIMGCKMIMHELKRIIPSTRVRHVEPLARGHAFALFWTKPRHVNGGGDFGMTSAGLMMCLLGVLWPSGRACSVRGTVH